MKNLLELSLKSTFVAYIVSAFDIIGGFEMHLNPLGWNQRKLILFVVFFILTAAIESFFIKKKK